MKDLISSKEYAQRTKRDIQQLIKAFNKYIKDIQRHIEKVKNIDYEIIVSLKREKSWYENKVYYYVSVIKRPVIIKEDITDIRVEKLEHYKFKGSERFVARDMTLKLLKKYKDSKLEQNCDLIKIQ
ncbi:hypothetical protein [Caldisalinibacter kiritimatiensis]|uniref:Uncharacterized protein n=1 Tax=Caldisalinibacter kiritimatiensis TaxID=1304284 RepID=R1CXY2_9FIRM|nr:hypothetical protein [Caldisalinibacter kiritimatiensis]EOD01449.1 hypothetical protein L21TH_0496 [Caldisalinibacter kiritimatiensis]